jgi:hypothetical protein
MVILGCCCEQHRWDLALIEQYPGALNFLLTNAIGSYCYESVPVSSGRTMHYHFRFRKNNSWSFYRTSISAPITSSDSGSISSYKHIYNSCHILRPSLKENVVYDMGCNNTPKATQASKV